MLVLGYASGPLLLALTALESRHLANLCPLISPETVVPVFICKTKILLMNIDEYQIKRIYCVLETE